MKTKIATTREKLQEYFSALHKTNVEIVLVCELGKSGEEVTGTDLKGFGYGRPYLIEYQLGRQRKSVVLETLRVQGGFGHDDFSDRAQALIWQHSAFSKLPCHVHSVDVGAFTESHRLKSIGDCVEFFIVSEFIDGHLYHLDLDRLKETRRLTQLDLERCRALSDYLVTIHEVKHVAPELYVRRIRDLVGHGECIFGLTDSYPKRLPYIHESDFVEIEKKCINWRWKLKHKTYRLSQVHGDFHPWNIMFREGTDFTVFDRSRGEWGEPADDLSALTVNYIFYSLQTFGKLAKPFKRLFHSFWANYLDKTGDEEILSVIQPFYAWRALVIASPLWYPSLPLEVRRKLFNFILRVLDTEKLELKEINAYLTEE